MGTWRLVAVLVCVGSALAGQGTPTSRQPPRWTPRGSIAPGDTVRDSLTRRDALLPAESTYAQEWRLAGRAGQTVTIDVVAGAFDAYAFLLGPGFERSAPQDDDSGGHCNARLTVRLTQTGDYFIVVTSSERFARGPFTLTVTPGSKPVSLAPCTR